jgi:peptide-methionine (S)-S-oxide reductase
MGGTTEPNAASGSCPAWIARVEKPVECVMLVSLRVERAAIGSVEQICASLRSLTRSARRTDEVRGTLVDMLFTSRKSTMIAPDAALRGRERSVLVNPTFHDIFGIPVQRVPEGSEVAYFGMGCFWGAEKLFWKTPGVTNTAVGYAGGYTPNPTYEEVCSARTGHTEAVKVCYDPSKISYEQLLKIFFENHDPTQGMRQGNDVGTQYRSSVYTTTAEQAAAAERIRDEFQLAFSRAGFRTITTEIGPAPEFYYAEDYHQQYLDKNPRGYCPIHATGVTCNVS